MTSSRLPDARLRAALLGGALAIAGVHCNAVLGIQEHELASDDGGSSGDSTVDAGMDGSSTDGLAGNDGSSGGDSPSVPDAPTLGDSSATGDGPACTPGAQQCSGTGSVQMCGADGQWSAPWPCATGTCNGGSCAGSTATGTSCAGQGSGITTCGSGTESCCTSLEVAGGAFDRTYDPALADGGITFAADGGPASLADPASVSGFRLDKYEVTVGRFRQYVDYLTGTGVVPADGTGKHAHLNGGQGLANSGSPGTYEGGWDGTGFDTYLPTASKGVATWNTDLACAGDYATWTPSPGTQESLPVTCVNWMQAYAFCIWDGGFLPSETEWEYAAAGGSQQRAYPWGNAGPGAATTQTTYGCLYGGGPPCSGVANIAPVGHASAGAGVWGQVDMAGSAWEWTLDWSHAYVEPCADCAYLTPATTRVDKGGCFLDNATLIRTFVRGTPSGGPSVPEADIGFRCARTP